MSIARFLLPCGLALVIGGLLGSAEALAGPGGGHGGRGKAVEACKDKSEGQSCTIEGSCFDAPQGRLCRPEGGPGGPR